MKRYQLFLINIFLILASPSAVLPQARRNALPKLLSVREQQSVREAWLKKRLDTMLLPMMRQQKIDMWIVTNEEFHADPVTEYIAPPLPYNGRRDFFIFTDRGGDKLDRIALVRYPEEAVVVIATVGEGNTTGGVDEHAIEAVADPEACGRKPITAADTTAARSWAAEQ